MEVTNVTVGYERKRQPVQFESAGAQVLFSASLSAKVGDTEDHVAVATALLGQAKTIVLAELNLVAAGESASVHDEGAKKTAAAKKAAAKKAETTAAADAGKAAVAPVDNDIPGEAAPAKTATPAKTTAPASSDIPDDPKPNVPTGSAQVTLTAAEVSALASSLIKEKKATVDQIKGISRTFGVERIADITDAAKLAQYKVKLDELSKASSAADI